MIPEDEASPVGVTFQAGGSEQGSGLQLTGGWNNKRPRKNKVKIILDGDKMSKNIRRNMCIEKVLTKIRYEEERFGKITFRAIKDDKLWVRVETIEI